MNSETTTAEGTGSNSTYPPVKPSVEQQAEEAEEAAKLEKGLIQKANILDEQNEEERKGKAEAEEPAAQKTCVVTKKYRDVEKDTKYVHGEQLFTKGAHDEDKRNGDDDVYVKFKEQEGGKRKKRKTAKKSRKTKKKARKTGKKARKTGKK